jgi:hypothetical protein
MLISIKKIGAFYENDHSNHSVECTIYDRIIPFLRGLMRHSAAVSRPVDRIVSTD